MEWDCIVLIAHSVGFANQFSGYCKAWYGHRPFKKSGLLLEVDPLVFAPAHVECLVTLSG